MADADVPPPPAVDLQAVGLPQRPRKRRTLAQGEAAAASEVPLPAAVAAAVEGEEGAAGGAADAHFEYLDHPADVQLHAWGPSFERVLESLAAAMVNYMIPLETVGTPDTRSITISGAHDVHTFVFAFLDEVLFLFHGDGFVARRVVIGRVVLPPDARIDGDALSAGAPTPSGGASPWPSVTATVHGEPFHAGRHAGHGTEVKAITYSAMRVVRRHIGDGNDDPSRRWEAYVIVDI